MADHNRNIELAELMSFARPPRKREMVFAIVHSFSGHQVHLVQTRPTEHII